MKFEERKKECLEAGAVEIEDGVEICGVSKDKRCWAFSCPAVKYWSKREPSYHKLRALEKTGLVDEYENEMKES